MKSPRTLWILATVLTVLSALYQRMTGPTYPVRVRQDFAGAELRARLQRSHPGPSNHPVEIQTADPAVEGSVRWKRFKTADAWQEVPMLRQGAVLRAELPNQPPAGKLQYQVFLRKAAVELRLPAVAPLVIRFRGDVPAAVLIVHVIAMFSAMLVSTRAGLAAWAGETNLKGLLLWTLGLLFAGGLILGPVVQKYAFGAYWTGWPFGTDLTDNKTAVAFVIWLAAWFALPRARSPRVWVIAAAVATLAVFMIPHSVLGSELDYSKMPQQ